MEYVKRCLAKGQVIKSPEGLALTLHRNGEADTLIEAALYPEKFEQTQKEKFGELRRFTDENCHVCNGSTFEVVEGKGARPCPHCVDERGKRRGKEPQKTEKQNERHNY